MMKDPAWLAWPAGLPVCWVYSSYKWFSLVGGAMYICWRSAGMGGGRAHNTRRPYPTSTSAPAPTEYPRFSFDPLPTLEIRFVLVGAHKGVDFGGVGHFYDEHPTDVVRAV